MYEKKTIKIWCVYFAFNLELYIAYPFEMKDNIFIGIRNLGNTSWLHYTDWFPPVMATGDSSFTWK